MDSVKIISIPEEINLYHFIENGSESLIQNGNTLSIDDYFKISAKSDDITNNELYIEYQYLLRDPDFEKFNIKSDNISAYPNTNDVSSQRNEYYSTFRNLYYSRVGKIRFKLCNDFCETCKSFGFFIYSQNCLSCVNSEYYLDEENNCKPEGYYIDKESNTFERCEPGWNKCLTKGVNKYVIYEENKKNCISNEEKCPSIYPFSNPDENDKCSNKCTIDDIKNNKCVLDKYSQETIQLLLNLFNDIITNNFIVSDSENNNLVMFLDNLTLQITTCENEKNWGDKDRKNNISKLILGDCEDILKNENQIPPDQPLIIFNVEQIDVNT